MKNEHKQSISKFQANEYPLEPGLRLLEASAGTGKTFAIAHLVLRLLTEKGHKLKQLLVVTFTEAAATELKARINNRLESALVGLEAIGKGLNIQPPDDILKQWLELNGKEKERRLYLTSLLLEALEDIDRADITTIHGFCKRTLQRQAIENKTSLNIQIEGEGKQLIQEISHDYWQQQVLMLQPKDLAGVHYAGLSVEEITKVLLKIDSDPSLALKTNKTVINHSESLSKQFEVWIKERWSNFNLEWQKNGRSLENDLRRIAEEWRRNGCKNTKPFSPKPKIDRSEIITKWIKTFSHDRANSELTDRPFYGDIRKQILLGNYFHPAILLDVAQHCEQKIPHEITSELQEAIVQLWDGIPELIWVHAITSTIDKLKGCRLQRGVMSYGDLLRSLDPRSHTIAKEICEEEESAPFIKKLRERYRVALIDEFQDTDPLQWRILKNSFGSNTEHLLLLVGDPKQAIYGFRGGDINTYIKARKQVSRIDALLDNFRTSAPLMDSLNKLMATGLAYSELKIPALIARTNEKTLNIPSGEYPLQVQTIETTSVAPSQSNSDLLSKTELEKVIPTVVANSVLKILNAHKNELQLSDICILVNRHNQADQIRDGLANAGVPTRLVSQGDIFKSEASLVLQRFLDCLANPGNSGNLRLVACSALMQWDTKRLKSTEVERELDQLAARFRDWSNNFANLGLLGCLAELIEGPTIADLSERGRMLGDLQQCAQLVEKEIHTEGLSTSLAARWLRHRRLQPLDPTPDDHQPNSDMAESAVNVVTIHRSKGLEYRVVICPYLWESPPLVKGPLWRSVKDQTWLLALNKNSGEAKFAVQTAQQACLQEAERLAYVAMTRAKDQLILIWALGAKQERNPLSCFLFGPDSLGQKNDKLTLESMKNWLRKNDVKISILTANNQKPTEKWRTIPKKGSLSLGPSPQRLLDVSWGRNSYSGWIAKKPFMGSSSPYNPTKKEDFNDRDQEIQERSLLLINYNKKDKSDIKETQTSWSATGPLSNFPRGPLAGECLHKILERINFTDSIKSDCSRMIIEEELLRAGLDVTWTVLVQDGLERIISTPIGGPLGSFRFNQLTIERRLSELSFDLPIAQKGNAIQSLDLAKTFEFDPNAKFGPSYAKQLKNLKIFSRGYLTGSIDLVFTDKEDSSNARWWVADWKSNWIGATEEDGQASTCGPLHYNIEAMMDQMKLHHYPLQAHLYLVALHRFLRWRLPNYSPERHLGGYVYVFLRGVPGEQAVHKKQPFNSIPGFIVEEAPLTRVLTLDKLLKDGGQ